eukprot:TRINITY_DN15584_c0_g1_i1.p1 TRINITY_DN15584_c0_g1~~TRINITY_DN15584_c0_g1_i1.p1  ORF type:complete len:227 (-),score=53.33 TRINITY_DN15584_c0_g1_i1:99-779(-)
MSSQSMRLVASLRWTPRFSLTSSSQWLPPRRSFCNAAAEDVTKNVHFCAVDGSAASLEAVQLAISERRPQQVMLETCAQRRLLAERRASALAAAAEAAAPAASSSASAASAASAASPSQSATSSAGSTGAPLSHADAIASVHGGLRGSNIVTLLENAKEIDAQVYTIDRPYQETQNAVAKLLTLRPAELLAFARHAASTLGSSPAALDPSGKARSFVVIACELVDR